MKNYFVYDGRANYDIESAIVVDFFQSKNDKTAKKRFEIKYYGEDVVLCDSNNNILYQ